MKKQLHLELKITAFHENSYAELSYIYLTSNKKKKKIIEREDIYLRERDKCYSNYKSVLIISLYSSFVRTLLNISRPQDFFF